MKDYKVVEIKALIGLMKKNNVSDLELAGLKIKMSNPKVTETLVTPNYFNEQKEKTFNDILFHSAE